MAAVASRNPFDILSEETPAAPAATPKPAEKQKAEAPAAKASHRGRSGPASRGGRYYQRGGGTPSSPREQAETEDVPAREGRRSGEERGRGRGRGGRGRGERGRGGHGRVFDRHSATGKADTEKKVNQGWGGDEGHKELKAEEEGSKDAAAETPVEDSWGVEPTQGGATDDPWGVAPAEVSGQGEAPKEAAPAETRRREEEEDNTLTYDQYLAQQREKSSVPKLEEVRKPNDGDDDLFKGAVQVVKDDEEDVYFHGKAKAGRQRSKKKDEKQVLTIDGPFADRQARRGGRGGDRGHRAGGRGRGGRGRGRGDAANGVNVNVDDQTAFPALT